MSFIIGKITNIEVKMTAHEMGKIFSNRKDLYLAYIMNTYNSIMRQITQF